MKVMVRFMDGEEEEHRLINGGKRSAVITTTFGTFHADGAGFFRWLGCRSITARIVSGRQGLPTPPPRRFGNPTATPSPVGLRENASLSQ